MTAATRSGVAGATRCTASARMAARSGAASPARPAPAASATASATAVRMTAVTAAAAVSAAAVSTAAVSAAASIARSSSIENDSDIATFPGPDHPAPVVKISPPGADRQRTRQCFSTTAHPAPERVRVGPGWRVGRGARGAVVGTGASGWRVGPGAGCSRCSSRERGRGARGAVVGNGAGVLRVGRTSTRSHTRGDPLRGRGASGWAGVRAPVSGSAPGPGASGWAGVLAVDYGAGCERVAGAVVGRVLAPVSGSAPGRLVGRGASGWAGCSRAVSGPGASGWAGVLAGRPRSGCERVGRGAPGPLVGRGSRDIFRRASPVISEHIGISCRTAVRWFSRIWGSEFVLGTHILVEVGLPWSILGL